VTNLHVRAILFCCSAALLAWAQAPDATLGRPGGAITEPFSDIVGVAELRDGRVIVSDRIERAYSLADFGTGRRRTIGRNGIGPNEYQIPFGPTRWRGDTLLGYDPNNRRLLRMGDDGSFHGTIPFPAPRANGPNSWAPPRAVDARGRVYWDSPIIETQPVIKRSMKARIIRWLPGSDTVEVALEFSDHGSFEHQYRYRPMPQTDAWVLASDGRIGVISAAEYRLRWYRNGELVETGPPIEYVATPVTAAEREAFRARKALEPAANASARGGASAPTSRMGVERARVAWPDSIFPAVMPPFAPGAALLAPGGDIWVRRTGPAREQSARVDILDAHGRRRATLRLPPRATVFALGAVAVYVIRTDDDGLQTLERYGYPALPR
jgi:hypothetical protein